MKILIADDHKLIRSGLIALFNAEKLDLDISEASNGREVIQKLEKETYDVVLMDLGMPELNGEEASEIILKRMPSTKILVFSVTDSEVKKMIDLGVLGYVLKDDEPEELYEAIKSVAKGKRYLSKAVAHKFLENFLSKPSIPVEENYEALSKREIEILKFISEGLTNREIGEKLNISERTVDSHRRNLLHKTGCKNAPELVKYAITKKLI